jgi:hypothetical protein
MKYVNILKLYFMRTNFTNTIVASSKDEMAPKFSKMDHLETGSSVVRRAAGGSNDNDIIDGGASNVM